MPEEEEHAEGRANDSFCSPASDSSSATLPTSLPGDEAVKRLVDECIEGLATVDDGGKIIVKYGPYKRKDHAGV